MKKILSPIIVLTIFFLFFLWLFSTRETTMDINLFGAGYVTLLLATYLTIISIGNTDYHKIWWFVPEDATPKQHWSFAAGNFLLCMTVCWASLNLPRESLSDISVVLYASFPVFVAAVAFIVRRLTVKGKQHERIHRKNLEGRDELVAVATYNDPVKAHIIKGVLETNGIEAVIFGDGLQQTIGAGAHIFPVSVMVKNSDKDAAEKLINE